MSFDAFISYSHAADGLLAPRLQDGLQRFAKPWWRRRALHVFRDETGLSVNPGLWTSIVAALDDSDYFVLLASPESARSEWVNREIEYWTTHKDPARILPVVTDGTWEWDATAAGFAAASTAVPVALAGAFTEEPRHIDMRWARHDDQLDLNNGRFRDQIADIAAPIYGVNKDDLAGADVAQHRRTIRTAWAAAVALVILTLLSGSAALAAARNASDARDAKRTADANAQRANAQKAAADASAQQADTARRTAEGAQRDATEQAGRAYLSAVDANQQKSVAQQNAEAARLAQDEAERNAAEVQVQKQAADVANLRLQQTNQQLASTNDQLASTNGQLATANDRLATTNDELATTNDALAQSNGALAQSNAALDQSNRDLEAQKSALAAANEALLTANGDLDSARLVALADSERAKGNLDTAMLLANEAMAAAKTDVSPARNEAFALQDDARHLDRYLPGPDIGANEFQTIEYRGGWLIQGGVNGAVLVWRPTDPAVAPRVIDTSPSGEFFALPLLNQDGSRLVAQGDLATTIWDTATGRLVKSLDAPFSAIQFAPDGKSLAVEEGSLGPAPVVVLVDLTTGDEIARWSGRLASDLGCVIADVAGPGARSCEFSPDSRYLLGWSDALASFVLWDSDHPKQTTTLYTPVGFSQDNPAPVPSFIDAGGLVLGVPDSHSLVIYDADGTAHPPMTFTADLEDAAVSADGTFAIAADSTGHMWRVDLGADAVTSMGSVTLGCAGGHVPLEVQISPRGQWASVAQIDFFAACTDAVRAYFRVSNAEVTPVVFPEPGPADDTAFARDANGNERFAIRRGGAVDDLQVGVETNVPDVGTPGCSASDDNARVVCGHLAYSLDNFSLGSAIDLGSDFVISQFDEHGMKGFGVSNTGRAFVLDVDRQGLGTSTFAATITRPSGTDVFTPNMALSPDGRFVATGTNEGVRITNVATGRAIDAPPSTAAYIGLSFTGDGGHAILVQSDLTTTVIDTSTGGVQTTPRFIVGSSGDGSTVLEEDSGNVIYLAPATDVANGRPLAVPSENFGFALNDDASLLAAYDSAGLTVFDTNTMAVVSRTVIPNFFSGGFAFSPDSTRVLASSGGGDVTVLRVADGQILASDDHATSGGCVTGTPASFAPQWSRDGRAAVVDGQVIDTANLTRIGGPLTCGGAFASATFPRDGVSLTYASLRLTSPVTADAEVRTVVFGPAQLQLVDCAQAGRNFTQAEWRRFEPGVAYRKTCDEWLPGT